MSLLTRTKGYFVVICVLMVAFLGVFSWRLLHGSYDSSIQPRKPSSIPKVEKIRRFQDDRWEGEAINHEKSGSEVQGAEVAKPASLHGDQSIKIKQGQSNAPVMVEDDLQKSDGSLLKLGQNSNGVLLPSLQKLGGQDSFDLSMKSRASLSNVYTRQGEKDSLKDMNSLADSQRRAREHYKSGASDSVHKKHGLESSDQLGDIRTDGTKPFTKDEISDLLAKIHELGLSATDVKEKLLSWQRGSNMSQSGTSHNVVMPQKTSLSAEQNQLNSYSSEDTRGQKTVHTPGKYRVVQLPSSSLASEPLDFHVNVDRARSPSQSNEIPEERSRNREKPSVHGASPGVQARNSDTGRNALNRTEQNRQQREKYLQLLKEKFEMSKAQNMSVETRRLRTDSQTHTDNSKARSSQIPKENSKQKSSLLHTENSNPRRLLIPSENSNTRSSQIPAGISNPRSSLIPTENSQPSRSHTPLDREQPVRAKHKTLKDSGTMRREGTGRRPDYSSVTRRYTKSMYEAMRSKYPTYKTHTLQDASGQATLRPDFCRGCFDYNFQTIIDHPKLCKASSRDQSEPVFLLMLISSAPANYQARTVIRQTWGAECRKPNSTLKCLFVVGLSKSPDQNSRIQLENDHHQDILQFGFRDSYANLTYKTVTSFKWATQNCYSASYVMKTDDDMYVNSHLIPFMLQAAPRRNFMGGSCWGSSSPNRDTSSKWFVSIRSFHKPKFPPMCSGTGYIMSMDVMRSVLFASRNVPFFHLEDVYVALCLQKYGVLPVNIMGFSNMFQEFGACFYKNSVMTSHQVPPELLEEFWTSMNKCPEANISSSQLYIIMPYPDTD